MEIDLNLYCRYHRAKGHYTDDCHILKRDIETEIRNGHLKTFVAFKRDRTLNPNKK